MTAEPIPRVVSGGQTGVDRAALDAAMALGGGVGGWCPAGCRAEDGPIPTRYPLREAPSEDPAVRTRLNVRDSDGTLVLVPGRVAGGTAATVEAARALDRPLLVVELPADEADVGAAAGWVLREGIRTLNVAGPRESEAPGVYVEARAFVEVLLRRMASEAAAG